MNTPVDTLVLTRREIAALMTPEDYLGAAGIAFRALACGDATAPIPMHLYGAGGAFHAKGASLNHGGRFVAIKLNGNFPENPQKFGLPTIQGAVLLADATNGSLLAVIDSIEITLQRTAAAAALAARHLARSDSSRVAICGCGEQGRANLAALAAVFKLEKVTAWDRDFGRSQIFAAEMQNKLHIAMRATARLEEAAADADIIVTCTPSRSPFLGSSHLRKGTFVAAIGADNPDKNEITPELMARSRIVVDLLDQCLAMGDLRHAVAAGAVTSADVCAELGQIVAGKKRGRTNAEEVWIFDSTGAAAQDVAAAACVYQRALALGKGTHIFFGEP